MDNLNIRLSEHAREVMARRSITFDEIAEVVARPKVVTTTSDPRYGGEPKRKYFGESLCVVVGETHKGHGPDRLIFRTIITVLLKEGDVWTDEDVKGRKK